MLQNSGMRLGWPALPTGPGDVIGLGDVYQAQQVTGAGLVGGMFRGRRAKAAPIEQALLAGTASVAGPDGLVSTGDLVAATGRTTPQWSVAQRAPIDKGLIESTGRGMLRFTMLTFAEFVREITGT